MLAAAATGLAQAPAADEIRIGQCAALTGPAAALGKGMQLGLTAAFDEVNASGGIHHKKLRLISGDDAYEPEKSVDCTGRLIEEEHVFALAGYVGTPTAKVVAPMIADMKVPFVGPFTGAMFLRDPVQHYVFNLRASYDDETEALAGYLTGKLGLKRIAVFYQDDSFGQAGLSGTVKALTRRSMQVVSKGSFPRNSLAIKTGLAAVMEGNPDAVIMVGPYQPVAEFRRAAKALGLKSVFATISFVGTESLIETLGADSEEIVISQVMPSPTNTGTELAKRYQAAIAKASPGASPAYVSFEGYVAGRLLAAALDKAGPDASQDKLVAALESLSALDLGGLTVSFTSTNHQASQSVYITQVKGAKAVQAPGADK